LFVVGLWIAAIVVAVIAVAIAAMVLLRRRGTRRGVTAVRPSRPPAPPAAPMTDLESALAKVTDRDGRPIRERIDAESVHVDPLRDPDDTGPLLRRALDSVADHDDASVADEPRPSDS
jgi:hypothetical protein